MLLYFIVCRTHVICNRCQKIKQSRKIIIVSEDKSGGRETKKEKESLNLGKSDGYDYIVQGATQQKHTQFCVYIVCVCY